MSLGNVPNHVSLQSFKRGQYMKSWQNYSTSQSQISELPCSERVFSSTDRDRALLGYSKQLAQRLQRTGLREAPRLQESCSSTRLSFSQWSRLLIDAGE